MKRTIGLYYYLMNFINQPTEMFRIINHIKFINYKLI